VSIPTPRSRGRPDASAPGHEDPAPDTNKKADLDNRTEAQGIGVGAIVKGQRSWSHRHDHCTTCAVHAEVVQRRRRMEIAGLVAGRRVIDLRDRY
jgi:hypothetical protein